MKNMIGEEYQKLVLEKLDAIIERLDDMNPARLAAIDFGEWLDDNAGVDARIAFIQALDPSVDIGEASSVDSLEVAVWLEAWASAQDRWPSRRYLEKTWQRVFKKRDEARLRASIEAMNEQKSALATQVPRQHSFDVASESREEVRLKHAKPHRLRSMSDVP